MEKKTRTTQFHIKFITPLLDNIKVEVEKSQHIKTITAFIHEACYEKIRRLNGKRSRMDNNESNDKL